MLPGIAQGTLMFSIGMSEPDTGSDLASVRTRATRRPDGGWRIDGTKIWTSGAHLADKILMLVRSEATSDNRHAGLTQLIVDLDSPGVTVRPILAPDGRHHFNEVVFDAVEVGDDAVLGSVGNGWAQVMSELSFERSGPERFLTALPVLQWGVDAMRGGGGPRRDVARDFARMAALRHMSYSVANDIERGVAVDVAAGIVKMLGTSLEGEIVQEATMHAGTDTAPMPEVLRRALASRASFTLRGGTNEVLQGVIAKAVGIRA
jgi:alkylation response protein AidB-like acyl-CoA dehydrogenase